MPTENERVHLPPAFRRMAWSNLAAQLAEQIGLAAAPLLAVLVFHAGAGQTGLLQTAQTLPFLLLAAPAGVLADRVSRRALMVAAEGTRALALLSVLLLLIADRLSLPMLAAIGFLGATGTVAYNVGGPALLPSIVPREALASANGRLELARSSAFAAGPALGGALVGWLGASAAYAFATTTSVFAIVMLRGLVEPERAPLAPRSPLRELRHGAQFVLGSSLLRPIMLTAVFFNVGWFVLQAAFVPYAVRVLHLSSFGIGLTMGIFGAGMVVGSLLAPSLARHLRFGTVVLLGPLGGLVGALLMALTIELPSPWLAGLSFFFFGLGPIIWAISSTTLRQAITPSSMLGRTGALVLMATLGARPVGAALGAFLGSRYNEEACLLTALLAFFAQFVIIASSAVTRLAVLPSSERAEPGVLFLASSPSVPSELVAKPRRGRSWQPRWRYASDRARAAAR